MTELAPDWNDVLRRAEGQRRRRARRVTAVAAAFAIAVGTGAAFGVGLFHGTAAPKHLQERLRDLTAPDAVQALVGEQSPLADVAKTHGLLEVHASDATFTLWTTPLRGGGRAIVLAQDGDPFAWTLERRWRPGERKLDAVVTGSSQTRVVYGAARVPVARVELELRSGAARRLLVVERAFLVEVPASDDPEAVVAYAASGRVIARTPLVQQEAVPVTKQRPPATGSFRRLLTIRFDGGTASVYGGPGGCFRLEQRQGAARDVSGACGGDARLVNILTASTSKAGTYLVVGHVRRGATLELRFATLPPRRLRLAEGYFLTTFEKGSRPTRWIVRDAAGHVAGTQAFASRLP